MKSTKIFVEIDWENAPAQSQKVEFEVLSKGVKMLVSVPVKVVESNNAKGFVENNGVISIEAANYTKATNTDQISFVTIPNLGRTNSAVTTQPVTAPRQTINKEAANLEYPIFCQDKGEYKLKVYFSPTLNYQKSEGLKLAISIDDNSPVVINMHDDATIADWKYPKWWNTAVGNNSILKSIDIRIPESGNHVIKYWPIDPGVVLQKIVLEKKSVQRPNYLGPPESKFIPKQ